MLYHNACTLPHKNYCCLLSSPVSLPHLLICTCLISSPIACPPSSVLCWCLLRFFFVFLYFWYMLHFFVTPFWIVCVHIFAFWICTSMLSNSIHPFVYWLKIIEKTSMSGCLYFLGGNWMHGVWMISFQSQQFLGVFTFPVIFIMLVDLQKTEVEIILWGKIYDFYVKIKMCHLTAFPRPSCRTISMCALFNNFNIRHRHNFYERKAMTKINF